MCQVYIGLVCAFLMASIQSGSTLQCWVCSSQYDVTCKDYFNITRIKQNMVNHENFNYQNNPNVKQIIKEPHQEICEAAYNPPNGRKYVCMKTVSKGISNTAFPIYKRECAMVPIDFKEGNCPDDISRNTDLQYCTTCLRDGCNSATGITIHAFLALFIPILSIFYFKN